MHELPIMREVLSVVMRHSELSESRRLVSVTLEVGELRDMVEHFVQTYWRYITRGTPAEGSTVFLHVIPATARCTACGEVYPVKIMEIDKLSCPRCGHEKAALCTGDELRIDEVEVRTVKPQENIGRKEVKHVIRFSIVYPKTEGGFFDMEYYISKHLPMVKGKLGPMCVGVSAVEGIAAMDGSPPAFAAVGYVDLDVSDPEEFKAQYAIFAKEIRNDIANFTNIKPIAQLNTLIEA